MKGVIINSRATIENRKSPSSWHHRMARLVLDGYSPKCNGRNCKAAAAYIGEYDYMRSGRPVSGSKLLCLVHAYKFAVRHRIKNIKAAAPAVKFSQLEFADRDGWAYGEDTAELIRGQKR